MIVTPDIFSQVKRQPFLTLLFAQAGRKDSLREIETSLSVHHSKWYHIGFKGVRRSTLSDAMNNRPYEIFEGIFYKLLAKCKSVTPKHKFRFKNPIYTLDSTSGLFKIRTPKIGKGKRGGIRTFLVYKESKKAIFVYGFSKNKKDNLDKNELKYFKKLAKDLLAIENSEYERLISLGNFKEIEEK